MALPEADYGMTELAMSGNQSRYLGDDRLLVRFFPHPKLNQALSKTMQRPVFEDIDYIQIMQPGNKDSIIIRPAMDMDKTRFAEHYKKYQARQDQDHVQGTLLEEWPKITRSQCEELRFFNIRTVEQLVNVSDTNAQGMMGFTALQAAAIKFLDKVADQKSAAELEAKLNERDEKIDALMARLEALEGDAAPMLDEVPDIPNGSITPVETPPVEAAAKTTRRRKKKE